MDGTTLHLVTPLDAGPQNVFEARVRFSLS